mgnify:CR=1 FL=1
MKLIRKILFPTAVVLGLVPGTLRAERIQMTDGRLLEGKILSRSDEAPASGTITLRLGAGTMTLDVAHIESIEPSTPAGEGWIEARDWILREEPGRACAALARASEAGAPAERLMKLLDAHCAAFIEGVDQMGPVHRRQLGRVLGSLGPIDNEQPESSIGTRIRLHVSLEEFSEAAELVKALGPEYFNTRDPLRRMLVEWLQNRIDVLFARARYDGIVELLDLLKRMAPEISQGRRLQFYLQWASLERGNGNHERALQLYIRHVLDETPTIARDRIALTLMEAHAQARADQDPMRAVELYQQYGLPHIPEIATKQMAQILLNHGWRMLRQDRIGAARSAFTRARRFDAERAQRGLLQCEYHQRADRVREGDLQERYELALWCKRNELLEAALEEFESLRTEPLVGENASTHVRQLRNQMAEAELNKLLDLFDQERYADVMRQAHTFYQQDYTGSYKDQARQIEELARDAIRLRQAERPQQAEALYQRAERAYYLGRYDEARQLLDTLLTHYRDTITYPRARAFSAMVRNKLDLETLEHGERPVVQGDDHAPLSPEGDEPTTRSEIRRLIQALRSAPES